MRGLRFGSLFAGIGGFDLALEREGCTCAWQIENNAACNRVLAQYWPNVRRYGDVKGVAGRGLAPVRLVVGGFPCQDLSVAGNRAGLGGERSGLWWEFHRVLAEVRPPWCIIENVPGLLSSQKGRDMGAVLGSLGQLGYGWAYRMLDAQWFGLAQRRARVFIVGHLGDGRGPAEILFEPEGRGGDTPPGREAGQGVAGTIGASPPSTRNGGSCPTPGHFVMDTASDSVAYTLDGAQQAIAFTERTRDGGRNLETQAELAYALGNNAAGGQTHSRRIAGAFGVRRLTPMECERLQGFPDRWTEGGSDSARYRMMGNAVAVPVAQWIAHRLICHIQRQGANA